MSHADLIARLESSTEGSRELSDEVLRALRRMSRHEERLDPSQSVDDALGMVSEGWYVDSLSTGDPTLRRTNPNHHPCVTLMPYSTNDEGWKVGICNARAATPALALCIAILRASE